MEVRPIRHEKMGVLKRLKIWFINRLIKFKRPENSINLVVRKILIGTEIEDHQLKRIQKSLSLSYYPKGTVILEEGARGDMFYFIKKGSVQVYTSSIKDGGEIILARLESGDFFGEQALLEEIPTKRMSSVRAITECEIYTLSHENYIKILNPELKKILKKIGDKQLFEMFSETQDFLGSIKKNTLEKFPGKILQFSDGEVIFKIHDQADNAYFILDGKVEIDIDADDGHHKVELGKGALFGELGTLNQGKRLGTATAKGNLKLISYDQATFKKLYEASPGLQQYIITLKKTYQIKRRGNIKMYCGKFLKINAVMIIYNLEDGGSVKAIKAIGNLAFSMVREEPQDVKIIHFRRGTEIRRKLGIANQKIVSVLSFGEWGELNEVCRLILDDKTITNDQIESFIKNGSLGISHLAILTGEEKKEIICNCLNITKGEIFDIMQSSSGGLHEIMEKTGAGSVCGTCRPKIIELFGLKAWFIVKLIKKIPLQPNIASFRFQMTGSEKISYKPGQYIIISAMINGQFINRSYTLTSVSNLDPYVEITVKKEAKGNFSPWLFEQADENSLIRISDPAGNFTLTETEDPIIFFAGGIGITPAVSYARYLANYFQRKLYIDYSAKLKNDFILLDEWKELCSKHNNMKITFRATGLEGRLQSEHIRKLTAEFPSGDFYVCGPGNYEEFIVSNLKENKVSSLKIKTERFIQAGSPKGATIKM